MVLGPSGSFLPECPQPCGRVDMGRALTSRRHPGQSDGDHGRLVEKLSPGMCTGWGDLVGAGSRAVTSSRPTRAGESAHPFPDQRVCGMGPMSSATRRSAGPTSCTRPGDGAGRGRGHGVERRRHRCTAVVLSTCRQQENADRPQSANRPKPGLSSAKRSDPQLPHL